MIETIRIFIRGWLSLDSNSGYPATRGLSTGGWREHVVVPVTVSPFTHKKCICDLIHYIFVSCDMFFHALCAVDNCGCRW